MNKIEIEQAITAYMERERAEFFVNGHNSPPAQADLHICIMTSKNHEVVKEPLRMIGLPRCAKDKT